MALIVRYFSTSSSGAGDGTTWADRAALFSTGNWSTVITGFAFNASDALECRIEGALTYTCSQALASGLFANAPTVANPLILHGCDNAGARLVPSNPDWVSAQPVDWSTPLPVIDTSTNISTINLAAVVGRCLAFTASGATTASGVLSDGEAYDWCVVTNSASNASAIGVYRNVNRVSNSSVSMTGSAYGQGYELATSGYGPDNVRIEGVAGSSGNRTGLVVLSSANAVRRVTIIGCGGAGITGPSTGTTTVPSFAQCVIANNAGNGIGLNSVASQTSGHRVDQCVITGNGGYGIDAASAAARVVITNSRFRDNASGNVTGAGNYPTDLDNYTTDSDDATEYVNAGAGDYRIKYGSAIWGQGYGAGDQPASGGGRRPRLTRGV